MPKKEGEIRLDKFLWATRIFKTRTIATEACKKGRVSIGGANAKPSRPVQIGEIIEVRKPPITYSFKVLDLAENRMGAKLVPQYLENVTPPEQYELIEMIRLSVFQYAFERSITNRTFDFLEIYTLSFEISREFGAHFYGILYAGDEVQLHVFGIDTFQ